MLVVWVYLGRIFKWEDQLSRSMKELVIPKLDPYNQASTISAGPFRSFPHYTTALASIQYDAANLLADMAGWTVYANENIFREALGLPPLPPSDDLIPEPADSSSTDDSFVSSTAGVVTITLIFGVALFCGLYVFFFGGKSKKSLAAQEVVDHFERASEMSLTGDYNKT